MTETEILLPKNDNIAPALLSMLGETFYTRMKEMQTKKRLRQHFGGEDGLCLQIARGEDIANWILKSGNPQLIGVSGSDLVVEAAIRDEFGHYHTLRVGNEERQLWKPSSRTKISYVDLASVFRDLKDVFSSGMPVYLESNERVTRMRALGDFKDAPTLCILGANDSNYEDIVQRRKAENKPVTAVCESRYKHLATNVFAADSDRMGYDFDLTTVTGATEGFIRQGGEYSSSNHADLGMEIGASFSTARANNLEPYERIMPTFPVEVVCYNKGQEVSSLYLENLRDRCKTLAA